MSFKIFLSYRRSDVEVAGNLKRRFASEFGENSVFLDFESITAGRNWKEVVTEVLSKKPVVVVLITTRWNSRKGGIPKLKHPNDPVRFELEYALENSLSIIQIEYENGRRPKLNELPESLYPICDIQTIELRQSKWDVYMKDLIEVITNEFKRLGYKIPKTHNTPESSSSSTSSYQTFSQPQILQTPRFHLTPRQLQESRELSRKIQERREQARIENPRFYVHYMFWLSIPITLALSFASVYGAELIVDYLNNTIRLPDISEIAALALSAIWALVWVGFGAAFYRYDPDEGALTFLTRGLLGGWLLGLEDFEPIGYWAAFPICTGLLWLICRYLSWIPYDYLGWSYPSVFYILLAVYTIPVMIKYSMYSTDEMV